MNVRVSTWWCAAAFVTGAVMAQTPEVTPASAQPDQSQVPSSNPSSSGPPGISQTPEADATLNEVVVTGSRIRNGNNTPTPVTSVSNVDLQATTPTSIPDALQKGGIFQDPGYTGSIGLRYPTVSYADVIGRYFTLGVRFKL